MKDNHSTPDERMTLTINSLRSNGFEAWFVNSHFEAEQLFWDEIFEKVHPNSVSWGDSMTLHSTGILARLKETSGVELIETFGGHLTREQQISNRKRALSCDMFLTGSNAVTVMGQFINLDMVGNRVAGIAFGPGKVVIFVGINKIVNSIDEGMNRIKTVAAPLNAKRHPEFKHLVQ